MKKHFLLLLKLCIFFSRVFSQQEESSVCKPETEGSVNLVIIDKLNNRLNADSLRPGSIKKFLLLEAEDSSLEILSFNYAPEGDGINCDLDTYHVEGKQFPEFDQKILRRLRNGDFLFFSCIIARDVNGELITLADKVITFCR